MKKGIIGFLIFWVLISIFVFIQKDDSMVYALEIDKYSQNELKMTRRIGTSDMHVEIICKDYTSKPEFTYTLYKGNEAVEDVFSDVRMELRKNNGVLRIHEHVYYTGEEAFAFDKISDILIHPDRTNTAMISRLVIKNSRNYLWEVGEVLKGFTYSLTKGIYNPSIFIAIYTYISVLAGSVMALYMAYLMYHHSIVNERRKRSYILDASVIILFILVLFVSYPLSDQISPFPSAFRMVDTILKCIFIIVLAIRLYIVVKVKEDWEWKGQ